jgi:uncharacterized membrane protein YecN with MAPEG domain
MKVGYAVVHQGNAGESHIMPSPLPLPVTLITASILTLLCVVLAVRVVMGRFKNRISLGDGDNADMRMRMRTHANLIEYAPLILILMGILEMSKANRIGLAVMGALLIVFRIFHAIGMPRRAPNFFRAAGTFGTMSIMAIAALWGLLLALTA